MNWKHLIGGQTLFYNAEDPHACRNNKKTIYVIYPIIYKWTRGGGGLNIRLTLHQNASCLFSSNVRLNRKLNKTIVASCYNIMQ